MIINDNKDNKFKIIKLKNLNWLKNMSKGGAKQMIINSKEEKNIAIEITVFSCNKNIFYIIVLNNLIYIRYNYI